MTLSGTVPALGQSAPTGSWLAGPDGAGQSTYIGRIESPTRGQRLASGAGLLVSGWAADTTASGWAGFDGVEVWNGAKDKGGTKLATGMVGLARADVGDSLGASFTNSGFNAVVPASATTGLSGPQTLYVYLHTPNKGTWYKTTSITSTLGMTLPYPNDPIVGFLRPIGGEIITQKQKTNKYTLLGYALDRNPITDANSQTLGPAGNGIAGVTVYLDAPRGQANSINLGPAILGAGVAVNNIPQSGPGGGTDLAKFSYATRGYGPQYDLSAWAIGTNPSTFAAEREHTAYAYARSSITGKESMASVTFFLKGGEKILSP